MGHVEVFSLFILLGGGGYKRFLPLQKGNILDYPMGLGH